MRSVSLNSLKYNVLMIHNSLKYQIIQLRKLYKFTIIIFLALVFNCSTVFSQNLLYNSSFEIDLLLWDAVGPAFASPLNANCDICNAFTSPGGSISQNVTSISEGCTYTLDFDAFRDNPGSGWSIVQINAIDTDSGNWVTLASESVDVTSTTYNAYSINLTIPSGADIIQVWLGSGNGTTLYMDCLELTEDCTNSSCANNLLANSGFESGLNSWGTSSNTSTTTDSYSGSTAATITSGTGGLWQTFSTSPGESHSAEAYIKRLGNNENASFGIDYYDSSNNWLQGYYTAINSTSYEVHYISGTAPDNAATVNVVVWKHAGSDQIFVDDLCMEDWNFSTPSCANNSCEIEPSYNNYIFSIDDVGDLTHWMDYDNSDLMLCDNGDGTMSIKGNIINGRDADWGSSYNAPCGSQDGWYVDLNVFDRQTWSEFQGNYEVNPSCPNAYLDLDYYDCNGTITGIGCNTGRTLTVLMPSIGYRLQIGDGGNSHNCDFGMSTWFYITENGSQINADIYANLDENCYNTVPAEVCYNSIDDDRDGLIDCVDNDCDGTTFCASSSGGSCGNRITTALQVLYDFNEGSGSTVHDVSGVGAALDLTIANPSNVTWSSDGLTINSSTIIESSSAASKVTNAIIASNAFSMEAWVMPANTSQTGPARIMTISGNSAERNATLGQETSNYAARTKTTTTGSNGLPTVNANPVSTSQLQHVVYTWDGSTGIEKIYVDNVEKYSGTRTGNASTWNQTFKLAIGNEFVSDRTWLGEIKLAAIYSKPLTTSEIQTNYSEGSECNNTSYSCGNRVTNGIQVVYDFNEGSGSIVNDVSGVGTPLNLTIANPSNTNWVTGGLEINSETIIESAAAASKVSNAVINSNEITLETWVRPFNTTQGGPARIMTISDGSSNRNCTMGQEGFDYAIRHKTTTTGNNGYPTLTEPPVSTLNLQHVVYTWNGNTGVEKIYIDGLEKYSGTRSGNTSTWDNSYKLAIANEIGASREWLGQINLAAIYNRALTPGEVITNYQEGSECDGNVGPENNCNEGLTIDHYGAGCDGGTVTVNVPNLSNVNETTLEIVYKGCYPGSTLTASSSSGNISFSEVVVSGGSSSVYVYTATVTGGVTNITHTAACGTCSSGNGLQSLVVYAERNVDTGHGYQTLFTEKSGYCGIETIILPIPTDTEVRDIELVIPFTELTDDGRYLTVTATSSTGGVSDSETIYGPDLSLGSCCFDFIELSLPNVPANSSYVTIEIISNGANNPNGNSCGQSWVMSGTVFSEISCPCVDVTADAGPDKIICTGNTPLEVQLDGSATAGTQPYTYLWSPTTGLDNPNIAQPMASPTSTTTYTLTVTGDDGCNDTDEVIVTVYNNYTDGGIISGNEGSCGSFDPAVITSSSLPSGGNGGTSIYQWQIRTYNCSTASWSAWSNITSATSSTYNPGIIAQTTEYRRLARRTNCFTWVYSNTVIKEVVENYTSAGSIAGAESQCGSYDPAPLTSSAGPSGGCGGTNLNLWRKREYDCSTESWGSWVTISGETGLEYDPPTITVTTQFRRQSRRIVGCTPGWVYATPVTKTVVENITDTGTIGTAETMCGGYDPEAIVISTLPSGGCGADIEYRWYERTQDCATGAWSSWALQANSNTSTWDPGPITQTTHYAYHARRGDCAWVPGPGVIKTVNENFTDAGIITGDETMCGTYDPGVITSTSEPSGGCGTFWGIWQQRELDCTNNSFSTWTNISGTANTMSYDPPTITTTTEYRRIYTRTGCNPAYVISNTVTKEVLVHYSDGGTIGSNETKCGDYDPEEITNITSPVGGCSGTQEVRWYMWERDCNTGNWITPASLISGATDLSYDPPAITVSTRYRRYVRRGSECTGTNGTWMVSNYIYKYVNEDVSDPGTITDNQDNCGAFDPVIITGTPATGGCQVQTPQYIWQYRVGTSGSFINISGANGLDYDPGMVTETTQYRRAVSYDPCPWTHSNIVTMTVHDTFTASATNDGPLTCNQPSVDATALPAGLLYSWTGGATTQVASFSSSGTYTVTVTDNNGCTTTASTIITEDLTTPLAEFIVPTQACEDDARTFVATDAGAGTTYNWTFGDYATPASATGIGPHNVVYSGFPASGSTQVSSVSLTVTGSNGCTDIQTSNVHTRPTPEVVTTTVNPSCDNNNGQLIFDITIGNNNGVTVSIDGGQSYTGTGLTSAGIYTVSNLSAGSYHAFIRYGSTECPTDLGTFYLEHEPTPTISLSDEIICEGASITLDPDVCERYPNITAQRPLADNTGWRNSYMDGSQSGLTGDGTLCFTLDEFTDNSPQMFGLNDNPNANVSFSDMEYAIYIYIREDLSQYLMQIRENGTSKGNAYSSATSYEGSTFCIRRTGTLVEYLMDDVVMYTSTIASSGTLYYDHSIHSGGGVWTDGYSKFTDISLCAKASDLDMSYSWSTGATTANIDASTNDTYTVTVTDYNGCTSSTSASVTINEIIESATNNGPITCSQANVILTASPSGMNYLWSGGGTGETKTVSSPGVYTVTITDSNGCSTTATTTVTEDIEAPTADAGNNISICDGATTTIGSTSVAGITYQWSTSGSDINGATNSNYDASPTTTTTYTLTATASNGCTDSDDVTVTVLPAPTASANGETICVGENATVIGTVSGGIGSPTYQWQQSASGNVWNDIPGATNINYTATALSATTYYRLIADYSSNGCGSAISNIASVIVETMSIASSITATQDSICINESTTLTVNEDIDTGGLIDYSSWTVGTGNIGSFNVNGSVTENHRISDTDPWGNQTVVWEARPEAASNADGGWNSTRITIDNSKMYRVSVWVNRKVIGNNGRFYLGSRGYGSTNGLERRSDGTTQTNPYFFYSHPPTNMPEDEWMLVVGHIYPTDAFGTTNHTDSGRYTVSNGKIGDIYNDYQWLPGTTESLHRTYLFYCTDTSVRQQFVYPRFDVVDGTEPTIDELLNGFDINGGLGTGAQWEWYEGSCGGTAVGTGTTITVNPTTTTTYYVRGEGNCGNSDCESITITVNNPPVASASNNGPLTCSFTSVDLTANPAGMSYEWEGGETTQVINTTTPGTYTVTVTDNNGCTATAETIVTENTDPTPIFCQRYRIRENDIWGPWTDFSGDCTIEFCEGDSLTDFQFDGGPDNDTGWVWTDEDGNIDNETDEIVLFSNIGLDDAGTYTGILTNEYGCTSEINFEVIVNPNPIAFAGIDTTICMGGNITLTASGGTSYIWDDPASSTTATIDVNPEVTTTYTVTVTDNDMCESTADVTVSVTDAPAEIILPDSNCSDLSSTYEAVAITDATYTWDFAGGTTADGDFNDRIEEVIWPDIFTDTTVIISLTVTTNNGCVNTATESVTIYALPDGDIQGDMVIVEGSSGIEYSGPPASSYEWSVIEGDAQIISGADQVTCVVDFLSNNSRLQLIVTNEVGCPDTLYQSANILPLSYCYYYDNFSDASYNNTYGTQDWSGEYWTEYNDDGNHSTGRIRIHSNRLRLTNHTGNTSVYVERSVNLLNIDNPQLSFDLDQTGSIENSDEFIVEVYDGTSWTTIFTYSGRIRNGFIVPTFDITPYANADTRIRFTLTQGYTRNEVLRIDDVNIYGECNLCALDFVGLESENTCEGSCEGVIFINPDYPVTGDFNLSYTYNGSVTNLGPYTNGDTVFISGLCAGVYSDVTISRIDNQCSEVWPETLTIGETGAEWEHVTHTDDVDNCDGICNGSFTIDANHGLTGEFTVSYTFEGTVTTLGPYDFAGDILIDDLCPGVYSNITITGTETGCSDVWPDDIEIVIERPEASVLSYQDDNCQESAGEAIVQVNGGIAPYTIEWNSTDGTHSGSTTLSHSGQVTLDGLIGGNTYCITVTDINGCENE
jgi:hypothetical protein